VCEKDTVPPTSGGGGQVPPECQGIIAGPSDKCRLGTTGSPTSPINGAPLTPQQQYENCLRGIGGGIPGNCKPPTPTSTQQNVVPQTITPQQTCKDGSTPNANGICQDGSIPQQTCKDNEVLTDKGNCVSPGESQAIKNGTLVDIGNGKFELGTRPPVPNTNTIAPVCPSDSHLVGSKCVVNGAGCPPGTVQDDGDITCSPFKQVEVPVNADGTCPEGAYSVGSSGNAGQPGTGSIFCFKNVPVESPPAGAPSNTPPAQPSQPKQLAPPQTLTQQTCPPLPIDANGRCPGIDMRGGGLGLPPVPPPPPVTPVEISANPDGTCPGVFDPPTNKCYKDNLHAPPCPGKPGGNPNDAGRGHSAMGFCDDPQTGIPIPVVPELGDGTCDLGGVHIATRHGACFIEKTTSRNPDGSCQTGYFATGNDCSLKIHDPLPDGTCPAGYHNIPAPNAPVPRGTLCKLDVLKLTNDDLTSELPGGYCPVGYQKRSGFIQTQCFRNS
jgi:hypothetical protein